MLLIFAVPIGVTDLADFIGVEEKDTAEAFIGVDTGRKVVAFEISSVT